MMAGGDVSFSWPGFIAKSIGYNAGFLTLASLAGAGLVLFSLCMPETADDGMSVSQEGGCSSKLLFILLAAASVIAQLLDL